MNTQLASRISCRVLAWTLAILVCGLTAYPQDEKKSADQPLRVEVNLVTLRFTVRDSSGRFVNTLQQSVFRVLDDGIPQDIAFFEAPRNRSSSMGKLWLAYLIDVSGSTFATRAEEILAARTFLDNVASSTETGIYGFTDKLIPFQEFTANRHSVLKAFRQARKHLGRTAIYDSLTALIQEMNARANPGDRKAVIIVSDGLDDAYRKAPAAITLARTSHVAIYTILVPSAAQVYIGSSAGSSQFSRSQQLNEKAEAKKTAFSRLSVQTGGKHFGGFEAILDFDDTLAQINDDIFGDLYSIGFYTQRLYRWSESWNIDVRVSEPGLIVSVPFKKLPRQLAAKKSLIAALFNNTPLEGPSGLPYDFHEIGAQMDVLAPRRAGGRLGLPFRIKISPFSFREASRLGVNTQLGVIGVLVDQQGRETVRLREVFRVNLGPKEVRDGRGILYTNKLLAPPGAYQLKVALLELTTWRLTSFERTIRITNR
ncbi:MAG: VWA domain-containing protein [Acidobacteriota bacterium]